MQPGRRLASVRLRVGPLPGARSHVLRPLLEGHPQLQQLGEGAGKVLEELQAAGAGARGGRSSPALACKQNAAAIRPPPPRPLRRRTFSSSLAYCCVKGLNFLSHLLGPGVGGGVRRTQHNSTRRGQHNRTGAAALLPRKPAATGTASQPLRCGAYRSHMSLQPGWRSGEAAGQGTTPRCAGRGVRAARQPGTGSRWAMQPPHRAGTRGLQPPLASCGSELHAALTC